MASPPPPHLALNSISRKRGSISSVSSQAKKRKPSQLRNSFAPENEAVGSPLRYSRSPSVDSVATTSVVNGMGGKKKRKKDGDTGSVAGSSVRGGKRGDTRSAIDGEGADGAEGEEEEDDDEDELELEDTKMNEVSAKQEKEHERMLVDAMNPNQEHRYSLYRRTKLKKDTVRKLVNQTLSQSVPNPIVIAVQIMSKGFIGELVDRALTVRDEWAAARTHVPNPNLPPQVLAQGLNSPLAHRPEAKPTNQDIQQAGFYLNQVPRDEGFWKEVPKDTPLAERLKLCDKGPLTPAHLREALRRYKRDRDGGGAGFAGLSLEGPERTLARTGGRRIFR